MKELLQRLVEIPGPSGYETQLRNAVRAEVEPFARQVVVDGLGKLVVHIGEKQPDGQRVMVSAHIDEAGVVVTEIDSDGFARVAPLGALSARVCLGRPVRFLNGARGVFGFIDPENKKEPSFDQLFIDLGCRGAAESPVQLGDVAVLDVPFLALNGRLTGKALDNRAGAAILIELARQIHANAAKRVDEIVLVFSVQEQMGMRGLGPAAFNLQPDLALAVDVIAAGDTPGGPSTSIALGKGPVIMVRDAHMIVDPAIVAWARQTAEAEGIPCQVGLDTGRSGARAVQLGRDGVLTCAIAAPCRYMGSGAEMVDADDWQQTLKLAQALLDHPFRLAR